MKNKIILLFIVFTLLSLFSAQAQKPELKGFYKFDFGISRLSAQKLLVEGSFSISRELYGTDPSVPTRLWWHTPTFANHQISTFFHDVCLLFYDDRFCMASVHFDADINTFKEIKEEITRKYFPCDINNTYSCKWIFLNGDDIELEYKEIGKNGLGNMMSVAIMTYVNVSRYEAGQANEKDKKIKENIKYY